MNHAKTSLVIFSIFLFICMGRPSEQPDGVLSDQDLSDNSKPTDENVDSFESNAETKESENTATASDADTEPLDQDDSNENTDEEVSDEQEEANSEEKPNSSSLEEEPSPSEPQSEESETDGEAGDVVNSADTIATESNYSEKPVFYESANAELKPAETEPGSEAPTIVVKPTITQVPQVVTEATEATPEATSTTTTSAPEVTTNPTQIRETKLDEPILQKVEAFENSEAQDPESTLSTTTTATTTSTNAPDLESVKTLNSEDSTIQESATSSASNDYTEVYNSTELTTDQPSNLEIKQQPTVVALQSPKEPEVSRENQSENAPEILTTTFDLPKLHETGHSDWFNENKWTHDFDTDATGNDEPVLDACSLIQDNIFQTLGMNLTKDQIQTALSMLNFSKEVHFEDLAKLKEMLTTCSKAILEKKEMENSSCVDMKNRLLSVCDNIPQCKEQVTELLPRAMEKLQELLTTDQLEDVLLMVRVCSPHDVVD